MPKWNVVVVCPVHKKEVLLTVEAPDSVKAWENALGMRVPCPWAPVEEAHDFVVEEVKEVFEIWQPPATLVGPDRKLGVITSVPEAPELIPLVPSPPEAVYVMPTEIGEGISSKLKWWTPKEYRKEVEKFRAEWRKSIEDSVREHEEERLKAKEEYERGLAEARVDIEKWRRDKEGELERSKQRIYEMATKPVDAITIIPAEEWTKIKEMMKRLKIRLV